VLATPKDVETLKHALSAATVVYAREYVNTAHLDFTWGKHAHEMIYPDILRLLRTFDAKLSH
jgi:hypothetical protein